MATVHSSRSRAPRRFRLGFTLIEAALAEINRAEIVVGALILAAVTSLPNAVAAVYLAARGRGAATLSIAMNSNAINVAVGLLLPAIVVGLGAPSGQTTLVAVWYLGLTTFALAGAYISSGLGRGYGALIICAYLVFAGLVLASAR